jgi:hypothetical protein
VTSGLIARKAERDSNAVRPGADAAVAEAGSSRGTALPDPLRRKFESSLGHDLSSVRVHTGAASAEAAHAVGAKAYTVGHDIHFGAGHYDPSSAAGEHLLAHEVAHTVQQGSGTPARQNKLEVSTPFDAAEHEADRAADAMVAGTTASVASIGAGISRAVDPAAKVPPRADAAVDDPKSPSIRYPSELKKACPALPANTTHPVFAKLANDYAGYEVGKNNCDARAKELAPVLGYSPDLTKAVKKVQAAAGPGSDLQTKSMMVNDRVAMQQDTGREMILALSELKTQGDNYVAFKAVADRDHELLNRMIPKVEEKEKAKDRIEELRSPLKDVLEGFGSWGWIATSLGNLLVQESVKIGTSLLLNDPQMKTQPSDPLNPSSPPAKRTGAQNTAAADLTGQASGNVLGAIASLLDGGAKEREELTKRVDTLDKVITRLQVAFDVTAVVRDVADLQRIEAAAKLALARLIALANKFDRERRAAQQAQGAVEAGVDKASGGKIT